ncbi:MAG: 50S ribosomal protein L4 [Alphaproteobacteria bacterium]|nr:50S ribosomal protein L4 [Alphaproteobacteria bacterium]
MKMKMLTLDNTAAGDITLNDAVFKIDVRPDIMARVVDWQLAKRRSGTHKVKERGEVNGSTRKFVRQKGSGGARHSTRKVSLFRGGGVTFGPRPRDHGYDLPKKVRALALRSALSMKLADGALMIIADETLSSPKTADLRKKLQDLAINDALIVSGKEINDNFSKALNNIPKIDGLCYQGANVYDILRRKKLVLTKEAVELLEARLA